MAIEDVNKLGGIYVKEYNAKLPVKLVMLYNESDPTKALRGSLKGKQSLLKPSLKNEKRNGNLKLSISRKSIGFPDIVLYDPPVS